MDDIVAELLLAQLRGIEARIAQHGQEMRHGFHEITRSIEVHEEAADKVAARVLVIETERRSGEERRKEERERADRRTGMIVTGINLIMGAAYFIGRIVWEWLARK